MKKTIFLLLFAVGCQTTQIKNKEYKVSQATVELGNIGRAKSLYNLNNDFSIHTIPVLQNKIRLDIQVQQFNKSIDKLYKAKALEKQSLTKISYNDSLPNKPEYITVNIMDLTGFATELNTEYNKDVTAYLKNTKKAALVTGLALVAPKDDIEKIKAADTFYLVNTQDKKYTVALYKAGKKTDVVELSNSVVLAYALGKFCWSVNDRQQWYIGEIISDGQSCSGSTTSHIKDKEEINLFKL